MDGVRRAGRNQFDVHQCASRPGIAFVDWISMLVDAQGAIEVSTSFYRTIPVIFYSSTPEDHLPFIIRCLQLKPDVEAIDGTTGKEVPNFASSHHDVYAFR